MLEPVETLKPETTEVFKFSGFHLVGFTGYANGNSEQVLYSAEKTKLRIYASDEKTLFVNALRVSLDDFNEYIDETGDIGLEIDRIEVFYPAKESLVSDSHAALVEIAHGGQVYASFWVLLEKGAKIVVDKMPDND